jgi:DNA-binding NtrC family response regulator
MPIRILVLDDDDLVAQILAKLLDRLGFVPTAATSVSEALRACARTNFDLIISETCLSDGNPLPLLLHCRQGRPTAKGIIVSCFDDHASMARAKSAGFSEYLIKPLHFGQLLGLIERLVSGSRDDDKRRGLQRAAHDPPANVTYWSKVQ